MRQGSARFAFPLTYGYNSGLKSGTFNFWIDRNTSPEAFTTGNRCRWGYFLIEGEKCVVCSDGATLAATLRMGSENSVHLFRIHFNPPMDRRHLVTIGWSKGKIKVLLDARLVASVSVADVFSG